MKNNKPKEETWTGFEPVGYYLEGQKVLDLPLSRVSNDGKLAETTIREALGELGDQEILEISSFSDIELTTSRGKTTYQAQPFSRDMMRIMLELIKAGAPPLSCTWYWYETDSVRDDPHDSHRFFIVYGDKLIRESVSISDYHRSGFDPSILVSDKSDPTWRRENDWKAANRIHWFRKFYRDTTTGQLLVLRPDEPELHCFPEGRWRPDQAFAKLEEHMTTLTAGIAGVSRLLSILIGILIISSLFSCGRAILN